MATSMQMRSSSGRSRGRSSRFRSSNLRRRTSRPSHSTRRRSRSTTVRRGRTRNLPPRGANGRFIKRRVRHAPRRRAAARRAPARRAPIRRRRPLPTTTIVREASRRSVAGPALVKRKWWRVDGPVDPALPEGYAYDR